MDTLGETHPAQGRCADQRIPVPLARALSELMAGVGPVAPTRMALDAAHGCILAAPLVAPRPVPPHAVALRPGFAVRAGETTGATPYSPALLTTEPVKVEVGSVLPGLADAVLPEDAVSTGPNGAEVSETAAPGQWTRRAGEDARAGTVLREPGRVLSSLDAAVASAAGVRECDVRRPKVALLRAPSQATPGGSILDDMLASLCRDMGAELIEGPSARSVSDSSLILAVVGPHPLRAPGTLAGAQILASSLALRPGEDGCLARLRDVPTILVPNRVADLLALWLCVVAPCLQTLTGRNTDVPGPRQLTRKIASTVGLAEVALLRQAGADLEPIATGDLPLSAIAAADFWHLVSPESEGYAAGTAIVAERLPGP